MSDTISHSIPLVPRSSLSTNESSPLATPNSKSLNYIKMKTWSTKGEWVLPEKQHFHEDLNVIFQEKKNSTVGIFDFENFQIVRKFIKCENRNIQLLYTKIIPLKQIGQINIIHGFEDHSGSYLTFSENLVKQGFIIHLIDLNGFGRSERSNDSFEIEGYHKDIEILLQENSKVLPAFIMGHSFGASILISFLLRNPRLNISGVFISSPIFRTPDIFRLNWITKVIINLIGEEYGDMFINCKINPCSLFKNNYNIRRYLLDPLLKRLINLKLIKTMHQLEEYINLQAFKFDYPIYIFHGLKNSIVSPEISLEFYNKISSVNKYIKFLEDGYHCLHLDSESNVIQNLILEWAHKRMRIYKNYNNFKNFKYGIPVSTRHKKIMIFMFLIFLFLLTKKSNKIFWIYMFNQILPKLKKFFRLFELFQPLPI